MTSMAYRLLAVTVTMLLTTSLMAFAKDNNVSEKDSNSENSNDITKRGGQPAGDLSDYFCVIECLEDDEDRDVRAIREAKDFLDHLPEITHSQARYNSDKIGTLFNLYERGRRQGRRAMLNDIMSGLIHNKGVFKAVSRDELEDDENEKANCSKECMFKGFFGRDSKPDRIEKERENAVMTALKHRFYVGQPIRYVEDIIGEGKVAKNTEIRHRQQMKNAENNFKSYLRKISLRNGRFNLNYN
ncbi:hypothetical protein TrispH2_011290 [Trichoplax sp. H2]|uniref:Uncharacterized protein n=1 Tax=Trichoplax adhaerens TaxID=10228 RepID=B3RIV7_TRIAD|nr:predicted protein [Trichoplax adhaerens]EDV28455.1 predicted protein [Trichoplax adhaerens]RDD36594.1 hypothetical protein TrispH2_011290 [Trichoplax sp. H2]|eukprot:XP_002107657.1 predicted protein [Trichoplax adhaerens]